MTPRQQRRGLGSCVPPGCRSLKVAIIIQVSADARMLAAAAAVAVAAQPSYPHYGGREVSLLDSETAWRFGYIDAFGDATRALSPQALAASAPPPPPRRPARPEALPSDPPPLPRSRDARSGRRPVCL